MKNITFEKRESVGILTINRPNALNALNLELLEEFRHWLRQPQELSALVLTGAGEKAFIAGADIKEMQALNPQQIQAFIALGQQVTQLLEEAPFITIAAVNGYALGGGLEIALACDFIYAAEMAKLGLPEVSLGIIPGFGGTQRLTHAVGARRALEMVTTAKVISAEEAFAIGLVNRLCDKETLIDTCLKTARTIAQHSQTAIFQAKQAIHQARLLPMQEGLEWEQAAFTTCFSTPERDKAMQAFLQKSTGKNHA